MKTAEEYIRETMTPIDVDYLHLIKLSKAMKAYAKEVAQEALNKAADHVSNLPYVDGINETLSDKEVIQVIGSTPIVTP